MTLVMLKQSNGKTIHKATYESLYKDDDLLISVPKYLHHICDDYNPI